MSACGHWQDTGGLRVGAALPGEPQKDISEKTCAQNVEVIVPHVVEQIIEMPESSSKYRILQREVEPGGRLIAGRRLSLRVACRRLDVGRTLRLGITCRRWMVRTWERGRRLFPRVARLVEHCVAPVVVSVSNLERGGSGSERLLVGEVSRVVVKRSWMPQFHKLPCCLSHSASSNLLLGMGIWFLRRTWRL